MNLTTILWILLFALTGTVALIILGPEPQTRAEPTIPDYITQPKY
jgi:hypothetical protein